MNLTINNFHRTESSKNTSFGANFRRVCDKSNHLLYKTNTVFFRNDFQWKDFAILLKNKYANTNDVTIINHACSDGEETYSLIMALESILGNKASKFFPIIAKDFDKTNIHKAKIGLYDITEEELKRITFYTKNKQHLYFNFYPANSLYPNILFTDGSTKVIESQIAAQNNIKNKVIFETSDILNDMKNIPKSNIVLICRNFTPYLGKEKREQLARMMGEKLSSNSLVAIGDFDLTVGFQDLLKNNGFEPTYVKNVYKKRPEPNFLEKLCYRLFNIKKPN